ncbi:trypsin-like serine protease, partial [Streptomyces sp. NPDC004732]|uniref:trypsin-like serine protease n=1 Tax=Streptomyces sp. NPDC004732 TaxID=3154290 RepID=UPI0033A98427
MSGSKTRSARAPRLLAAALASTICAPAIAMLATAPAAHALTGDRAPAGDHSFTAQLHIGGKDPLRGCSGAVVSKQWLLTATSCFATTPGADVPAGKPALKSTATVGKQSIDIIEVVPRDDRDVAMVRLAQPVADVAPVPVASDAPATGETLTGAGFGRTKTTWVPDALHTGSFRVDSTDSTTAALTGLDGASVCKGDAGGPLLRVKGGKSELVSLHSRSWQGGCLGSQATRTEAVDARVDDLAGWVKDVSHRDQIHPADIDGDGKADLLVHRTNGDVVYHRNLGSRFAAGTVMSSGWGRFVDGKDLGRLYFSDITGDGKADLVEHRRD